MTRDQCDECGSPYDRGCGAKFHDTAPPAPEGFDPVEYVRLMTAQSASNPPVAESGIASNTGQSS